MPAPAAPFTPGQFEYDFWSPEAPNPLWDSMTASITVNSLSRLDQAIFFTIDAWFADNKDPFYMGLQPNGNLSNGSLGKMALFSFFGAGASSTHPNCTVGADDGPGVSCHVAYPWVTGRTYRFQIERTASDAKTETWTGSVTDTKTGSKTEIGWWAITIGHGLVGNNPLNFTEYYLNVNSCEAMGHASVTYGAPIGSNAGKTYPTTFQSSSLRTCGAGVCLHHDPASLTVQY
jgi:hypothetical protein